MAKPTKPKGGRPPGRRGGGGVGPGPAYRPSSTGGGTTHKGGGCCPMVAAVRAARAGRYRLARRYAAMSVRLIAARVA